MRTHSVSGRHARLDVGAFASCRTKTSDIVDAVVVTTAVRQKATILTSDPDDIERLVRASGREVAVVAI